MQKFIPRLIVLELTRRCILNCLHCRASSHTKQDAELKTQEWLKFLEEIASFCQPSIIFSGGEALLRDDIFEIISFAKGLGLTPVIATCGVTLTQGKARQLKRAGIKRVSVSIDGKNATTHDSIRNEKGVFVKALTAMRILKSENIEFQVNTTLMRDNVSQLEEILQLAQNYGAKSFHPFFLVPVGRGGLLKGRQLSAEEYEAALTWLFKKTAQETISCRPTCAPHYFRIAHQENFNSTADGLDAKTFPLKGIGRSTLLGNTAGCLCGRSFCFISSTGKVYPCGFLEVECGDARTENFRKLWQESGVFNRLRDLTQYKGKCGECEYLRVCGGCRARAYAAWGDYLKEEPDCVYQPLSVKS